jgi:hypothetical protein
MALTTVTLKAFAFPAGVDNTQRRVKVSGQAVIAASPLTYATGGIAITWTFTDVLTGAVVLINTTATSPIMAYFTSIAGSGYSYDWNKATNKLQILTTGTATQAAQAELAAGVVPAGVSGDVIEFDVEFVRAN